jgi:hypothetical protein
VTPIRLWNVEIVIGIETIPKIGPTSIQPVIQQFLELWRKDIAEESEEAYQRPYLCNPVLRHSKPSQRDGKMHKSKDSFTSKYSFTKARIPSKASILSLKCRK